MVFGPTTQCLLSIFNGNSPLVKQWNGNNPSLWSRLEQCGFGVCANKLKLICTGPIHVELQEQLGKTSAFVSSKQNVNLHETWNQVNLHETCGKCTVLYLDFGGIFKIPPK